jgi:hypothetical protein
MCNDYLKVAEQDAAAKIPTQAGTTARGEDGGVAVLPEAVDGSTQIDVGDAKKVFEKFFRKRAIAASAAGRTRPAAATRYSVAYCYCTDT